MVYSWTQSGVRMWLRTPLLSALFAPLGGPLPSIATNLFGVRQRGVSGPADRFDPFYSPLAPGSLGLAHYMLRQYSQALPLLRECDSWAPNLRAGHVFLAATYAQLGNIEQARVSWCG